MSQVKEISPSLKGLTCTTQPLILPRWNDRVSLGRRGTYIYRVRTRLNWTVPIVPPWGAVRLSGYVFSCSKFWIIGYIGDATVSEKRVPTTFSLAWGILKEDTPIFVLKNRGGRLFLFIRERIRKTVFYLLWCHPPVFFYVMISTVDVCMTEMFL